MNATATAARARARELASYLAVLAGPRPTRRLIEIRYPAVRGRMRQVFIPANRQGDVSRIIQSLSTRADVYVGVLLRDRRAGGRDAVSESHLLWAEIDRPDALERLARFPRPPTMAVLSGTRGHAHAYWLLRAPVGADLVSDYNRQLAAALGADPASVDPARVLRPPGSVNRKHSPPAPVELACADYSRRYHLGELLDGLPQPTRPETRTTDANEPVAPPDRPDDRLLRAIPAATYIHALTGREPNRAGKLACPLHDDTTPSLQLYDDGTWYCFGCAAGGSIYDFAGRLWKLSTKGREFLELRDRLHAALLNPLSGPARGGR
jgi:hypothetical protein